METITLKEAARIAKRDKSSLLKAFKKDGIKLGTQYIDDDEYRGQKTIVISRSDFNSYMERHGKIEWR